MKRAGSLVKNLTVIILILFAACNSFAARIIYVDDDSPVPSTEDRNRGLYDGSSWEKAYKFLQEALGRVEVEKIPAEIRVAQGIYKPNQFEGQPIYDRYSTFYLNNDVTIKGGYAGVNQPDPNARNVELYKTILSGDLNGDDAEVMDVQSLLGHARRIDNCFHVCTAWSTEPTSVIDGLYITGGNADDDTIINSGGGIFCPTYLEIKNCTFQYNTSTDYGGAIYNYQSDKLLITNCNFIHNASMAGGAVANTFSNLTIEDCTFEKNFSLGSGGAVYSNNSNPLLINCKFLYNISDMGGGMYTMCYSDPTLIGCTFTGNSVTYHGGGLYNKGHVEGQLFYNCTFKDNHAGCYGGGIYNTHGSMPTIKNCLFDGNSAEKWGGGLHFYDCNALTINCTIVHNSALRGAAIGLGFDSKFLLSNVKLTNGIIWYNSDEIYNYDGSHITTMHSCMPDLIPGRDGLPMGMISQDPMFVNPGYWADINDPNIIVEPDDPNAVWIEGDYHLKSQAGRWDPESETCVFDDVTSPCIDAGDPNSPVGDEPFPNGGIINMGAYGGTAEAGKSYFGR